MNQENRNMTIQKPSMEQHLPGQEDKGFVTMTLVTVIAAVGLFIALSIFYRSNLFSEIVGSSEGAHKARALASACIEEGLQKVRDDPSSAGSFELSLGGGSCDYQITNISPDNSSIHAIGEFIPYSKVIDIQIDKSGERLIISSWQEDL
jgi:hypothetical protein